MIEIVIVLMMMIWWWRRRVLIIILTILFINNEDKTFYLTKENIEMNLDFKNENWGDPGGGSIIL